MKQQQQQQQRETGRGRQLDAISDQLSTLIRVQRLLGVITVQNDGRDPPLADLADLAALVASEKANPEPVRDAGPGDSLNIISGQLRNITAAQGVIGEITVEARVNAEARADKPISSSNRLRLETLTAPRGKSRTAPRGKQPRTVPDRELGGITEQLDTISFTQALIGLATVRAARNETPDWSARRKLETLAAPPKPWNNPSTSSRAGLIQEQVNSIIETQALIGLITADSWEKIPRTHPARERLAELADQEPFPHWRAMVTGDTVDRINTLLSALILAQAALGGLIAEQGNSYYYTRRLEALAASLEIPKWEHARE